MTATINNLNRVDTGIAIVDAGNVFVHANTAFIALFDLDEDSLDDRLVVDVLRRALGRTQTHDLERRLIEPTASIMDIEHRSEHSIRVYIGARESDARLIMASRDWPDTQNGGATSVADQLDPLTGFGNRLMFERSIDQIAEGDDMVGHVAVLAIDLDRFKQVNDTLGHLVGDELLQLMGNRLRKLTREDDQLIRMGGDEFVILQTDSAQPDAARGLAPRLASVMARPFLIDGHQVDVSASIGVALLGHGTVDAADLLKHADLALYEAKRQGRSRYCIFRPDLEADALARRQLEVDLRRALGLRQFQVVFQPQTCTSDGRLSGFEALLRWVHPDRGPVSPADFIPVAEEIGEIHAIGAWVLRSACREAVSWTDDRLSVAVNVSPVQFENDDIVDTVVQALRATGLAPERLEIEITEGALLGQSEAVVSRLWAIHEMGVSIAMDDFGTGYASLSYLNSFPFSKIKIDKSFIQTEHSPRSQALISAILAMGASMEMATIAEGVETSGQYEAITRSGCHSVQGYYISKPMGAEAVAAFVQSFDPSRFANQTIKR